MSADTDELHAAARAWIDADPDPETRAELEGLLAAGDETALAERFASPLTFGTAGIRGPLGAGPARMNRVLVRRVSAGLAARLAKDHEPAGSLVVVGRDARHKSDVFAADTAAVLAGAGFRVALAPSHVPTPLLAFAVRHLGAVAGVQVTASHNPPADNGYKVYWDTGAQIVAPLDGEIAERIAGVAPGAVTLDDARVELLDLDALGDAYQRAALALVAADGPRDLRIVTTALHGVAGAALHALLRAAGFTDLHPVTEQQDPDPDFPTVAFPNPEMPGALDLALALADEVGADLILANDPDGDRIAAAVPGRDGAEPWVLSGDEVGCLLAEHLLAGEAEPSRAIVATTVVSSQLLGRIAAHHGAGYAETLTGFKWLAPVAERAAVRAQRFLLAYEQALGVMVGDAVRDKDGLSAALVFADLAARLKDEGRSLADARDALHRRHGVHATAGRNLELTGADADDRVVAILEQLRSAPPGQVGGVDVVAVIDRIAGTRRSADGAVSGLDTPTTTLVGFDLADGSRVQVRPSGTEPLLKCYVEVIEPVRDEEVAVARARAADRLEALAEAFVALIDGS